MRNLADEAGDNKNVQLLLEELDNKLNVKLEAAKDHFQRGKEYLDEWDYQVDFVGTCPYEW